MPPMPSSVIGGAPSEITALADLVLLNVHLENKNIDSFPNLDTYWQSILHFIVVNYWHLIGTEYLYGQ